MSAAARIAVVTSGDAVQTWLERAAHGASAAPPLWHGAAAKSATHRAAQRETVKTARLSERPANFGFQRRSFTALFYPRTESDSRLEPDRF